MSRSLHPSTDGSPPRRHRFRAALAKIGPGLITGAANDDPGAIGTHAQVGAQFGTSLLWLAPYTILPTAVVLKMCAQIGAVAGEDLASVLRYRYPRWVLGGAVTLLVIANLIGLAADLAIIAEAVRLLLPGSELLWLAVAAAVSAALQVFVPYEAYERVLKLIVLSLFAYVATAIIAPQDWSRVMRDTVIPTVPWTPAVLTSVVAVVGTRLSPYVLFWQPAQMVEEEIEEGRTRLAQRRGATRWELFALRLDVVAGTLVANLVTWAIMVTTAATLHARGITTVATATQAAEALRPAAGHFASLLFALGILGTGLLAIPVLSGGIAYAVSSALGWRRGLGRSARQAPRFYALIVGAIVVGALLDLAGVPPMRALFLSQLVNGFVAVPLVYLVVRISNDRTIMGARRNGPVTSALGWLTLGLATLAALAAAVMMVRGS